MTLIEQVRARRLPSPQRRREIRLRARVTQQQMADELGIHRITFVRWESGAFEPSGDRRDRYVRLLADLRRCS